MGQQPRLWAVVPAGGSGTRLWPLSRAARPKFLLDLEGAGRSMLQATVDRLTPLVGDRVLVMTGERHAAAVRDQLPGLPGDAVVPEPAARNSMAAIGLAAAILERRDPDAVLGSFAADHVVSDVVAFHACVERAVATAQAGWLVTIGIEPDRPATGFGYIQVGDEIEGLPGARHVRRFVEKPSAELAATYCASGDFRWNAGMFVVRPGVLLDLLATWHPDLAAALRSIAADPAKMASVWPALPSIAIDHAVAEPAAELGRVAVVPGDFGWDDIGDFASLAALRGADEADGPAVLGDAGQVLAREATGLVVPGAGRLVAVVGIPDVVVVDTGDAVLVTTRDRAQDVGALVADLQRSGHADLT